MNWDAIGAIAELMAAVGVIISLVFVGLHLADSREAAYTVGFFLFWVLFALSSGLTWILASGTAEPPSKQ